MENSPTKRSVLVTGATGLVGGYLLMELIDQGHYEVFAGFRNPEKQKTIEKLFHRYGLSEKFELIKWVKFELNAIDVFERVSQGINTIIHCASLISFDESKRRKILKTNVEGTQNLVDQSLEYGIQEFVQVSSIAALDAKPHQELIDESCVWDKEKNHSTYAESKYYADMEVWRGQEEGLKALIVKPGVVLGSLGQANEYQILKSLSKSRLSLPGGTAFIDVRDLAKCIIKLLNKNAFGEEFIITNENLTYLELANCLRTFLEKKPSKTLSSWQLSILNILNPFLPFFGVPRLSQSFLKNWNKLDKYSNQKLKKYIDHEFIGYQESVNHFGPQLK